MRSRTQILTLFLAFFLCFTLFTGCGAEGSGSEEVTLPWQDVYGPSMRGCESDPGDHPELTEEILAERDEFLLKRQDEVTAFWEKNKEVLCKAGEQFAAIYEQHNQREYYYEIAGRNLVAAFQLPDNDPKEQAQRAQLTETLEAVSDLPEVELFERIYINNQSMNAWFCEFSGALQLYPGAGCYISLGYLPEGEPERIQPFIVRMLDEHWALIRFGKRRDQLEGIEYWSSSLPNEKALEVSGSTEAKQMWEQYLFLKQNQKLMEEIAADLTTFSQETGLYYTYRIETGDFSAWNFETNHSEDNSQNAVLLEKLKTLSALPDAPIFRDVYGTPEKCSFEGEQHYLEGWGYGYDLCYSVEELSEDEGNDSFIRLDDHWYLSWDCDPG